jgi:glycosyltransferase involved in cell wall biosynthesis
MVARATVIMPTFGQAEFAVWPIKSVQAQTVRDIEICILCDGSSENMVGFFNAFAKEDPRIRVFSFPKGPRNGEEHRDVVIRRKTQGRIICYCSHDDLWLPDHIEEVEKSLGSCCFTHTIHANINTPGRINEGGDLFSDIGYIDLGFGFFVDKMLAGRFSAFGLTNGAHTRIKCKIRIENKPIWHPTDLYMWNKFLLAYRGQCKTHAKLTAIHFPISYTPRREWSEAQRYEELGLYYLKILDPVFLEKIRGMIRDYYRIEHENFLNHPRDFVPAVTKKIAGLLRRSLDR